MFSVFALVCLTLFQDKLVDLRAMRTQNFERRRVVQEKAAGQAPELKVTSRRAEQWRLTFIFVILGVATVVSWVQLWRTRLRHKLAANQETPGPSDL